LDRIGLHVELEAVAVDDLVWAQPTQTRNSTHIRETVFAARERQIARQGLLNSEIADGELRAHAKITDGARLLLTEAVKRIGISARGFTRVLRVAVTISDLAEQECITEDVVAEAISYRSLDRLASIIHGNTGFMRNSTTSTRV
jgi:magnesium chelatase family protein